MNRNRFGQFLAACFSIVLSGCSPEAPAVASCDAGYDMASNAEYNLAVPLLIVCLNSQETGGVAKRRAFLARAWAYSNLDDPNGAVADQEAAFQLSPASHYNEFMNYASYLRAAKRISESMAPLKAAEALDKSAGHVSMMTQYHIGWSLQELGNHEEAIAAFSRGIADQPDYAFAYYRRGVSLDALGRKGEARKDFEKTAQLIKSPDALRKSSKFLPQILEKFKEYGIE